MNKIVLQALVILFSFSTFAQSPEWTEFSRLTDSLLYNDINPEKAFSMYNKMDSLYNGIPIFSDLYNYLTCAISCNEQEKMKELEKLLNLGKNYLS